MEKRHKYEWKYCSLGGAVRIAILSGADIAHLRELDEKLWTVLSCPVNGLEFCQRTLELLDSDKDGKIRVNEVVGNAEWITSALKNPDDLLKASDTIPLSAFNEESENGKKLKEASEQILKELGLEKDEISVADVAAFIDGINERCDKAKEAAAKKEALSAPYGEASDDATAVCTLLRDKIADYFLRCGIIDFDNDCQKALDVSVDSVAAISGENLAANRDKIAAYPIARPTKEGKLPLNGGINPAWSADFAKLKALVLDVDFPGAESIDSNDWNAVLAKIDAYVAGKNALASAGTEVLDSSLAAEKELIAPVEKFVYLHRDFYSFLCNFVSLKEFYIDDKSMFQAGRLYIDRRACDLCVKVSDLGRHANMAGLSGMFLIYCDCVSKVKNETIKIVAVMTEGNVNAIRVGKNAVFYDRNGLDWDATVTQVVENPVSIKQAILSPYRRFFNWCSEQIQKFAADKESKSLASMKQVATEKSAEIKESDKAAAKKTPFDIAKFAGIFAAIGMALGYIGTFLTAVFTGWFALPVWAIPLPLVVLFIVISGPSMLIAWIKLRKRDLGPVLNANGWAINSVILVNTKFGKHLTSLATYPALHLDDPYVKKKSPWKIWVWAIAIILVAAAATLYFTGNFDIITSIFKK